MSESSTYGIGQLAAVFREPLPATIRARRRLARALQSVACRIVRSDTSVENIEQWADVMEGLGDRIADTPQKNSGVLFEKMFQESATREDMLMIYDYEAFHGGSNPITPLINYIEKEGKVAGTITFGDAYQGPLGRVHGGVLAWHLDALLSRVQQVSGVFGVTGSLTTKYLRGVPINRELFCEAWCEKKEGRKSILKGQVLLDGEVCVEAEGVWISPRKHPA